MKIRRLHFIRLILRALVFLAALIAYIVDQSSLLDNRHFGVSGGVNLLVVIWLVFFVDMLLRFFPSRHESMGCQKQFERNFRPIKKTPELPAEVRQRNNRSVLIVAAVWIALNGVIGVLHLAGVLDKSVMLLLMLFYSVCDIVCILFYCPFQSLMMKNRCCVSCRIYNWDFAMMFTPAIFVRSFYTVTLLLMALALIVRWEITYRLHPERFSEVTNANLSCANCQEHLCVHKKAIRDLARQTKNVIYTTASEKLPEELRRRRKKQEGSQS